VRAGRAAARRLAVEGLLALGGPRDALGSLAAGPVDWDHLLALAARHAIAEALHVGLERAGAAIPSHVRAALRDAHEGAAARNALLLAEAARVQAALSAGGVRSVLLKGTALLAAHAPAIGCRHVGDVDLLVAPADLARAGELAREIGCRSTGDELRGLDGRPSSHLHLTPLLTPRGTTLELHRRPAHARETAAWTAAVLARSVPARTVGGEVRVPEREDQLAVACEHARHGALTEPLLRPRHLGDLALLVAAGASFEAAAARLPGAAQALGQSRSLLEDARRAGSVERAIFGGAGATLRTRFARLGEPLRVGRASAGIVRTFLPAPGYMAQRYGVRPGSPLLPLLYAWRPFRSAARFLIGR
jgi:hypothetical protein